MYQLQLCRRHYSTMSATPQKKLLNALKLLQKNLLNTFELMLIDEHCVTDTLFW